jgi:hypothetical protein
MPDPAPILTTEQLAQVLRLLKRADSVELKLSVPDANRRFTVAALGMDPSTPRSGRSCPSIHRTCGSTSTVSWCGRRASRARRGTL